MSGCRKSKERGKEQGRKQAAAVTIIGGSDGPTSVFLVGKLPGRKKRAGKTQRNNHTAVRVETEKITGELNDSAVVTDITNITAEEMDTTDTKKAAALENEPVCYRHSVEEFKHYLKEAYQAVKIPCPKQQERSLCYQVFVNTFPELCPPFPALPDFGSEEQMESFVRELSEREQQLQELVEQQRYEPVCYEFVFRVKSRRIGMYQVYLEQKSGIFTVNWDTSFRKSPQERTMAEKLRHPFRLNREEAILERAAARVYNDLYHYRGGSRRSGKNSRKK